MKTYFDYSEMERSELTEQQINGLLDVALMEQGVLKPLAPTLKDVPETPVGPRKQFFGIEGKSKYGSDEHIGICFETLEQAQAFMALKPLKRDYDYEVGHEYAYAMPIGSCEVKVEELYEVGQINAFRSVLKNRKALTEENQQLSTKFKEACSKAERVTGGVWKDWYRCCSRRNELSAICDTFKNYSKLTSGDSQLALTFLSKAHTTEDINEAREWFPGVIAEKVEAVAAVEQAVKA